MNLFRRHKKFEEQLKEQLGDMEYKPSTSLWDRIDSDITKDGFETNVRHSLENFEQVPYSDTWDKIAAELPEERTGNRAFRYYGWGALALLFTAGVWIGTQWHTEDTLLTTAEKPSAVAEDFQRPAKTKDAGNFSEDHNSLSTTAITDHKSTVSDQNRSVQQVADVVNPSQEEVTTHFKQPETIQTKKGTRTNAKLREAAVSTTTPEELHARVSQHSAASTGKTLTNPMLPENSGITASDKTVTSTVEKQERLIIAKTETPEQTIAKRTQEDAPVITPPVVPPVVQNGVREVGMENSAPDSLASNSIPAIATPKQEELTRFSISILAGAHMSYMVYNMPVDPQYNFKENIALRKKLERPDLDWSGGFLIDYRLNEKWMVSSGMIMVNFSQQFDYNTVTPTRPVNPNETSGAVYKSQDSVITGNTFSNRIKYSWTEVPIFVNYNLRRGQKWDIDLQAGAGFAFVSTVDAGMIANDNRGVFALRDKSAFPQIKNSVFVSVMPQVSYRFGENVSVGCVPTFKYSVTSMIENERWVQQHPYFVGINLCLRKRF